MLLLAAWGASALASALASWLAVRQARRQGQGQGAHGQALATAEAKLAATLTTGAGDAPPMPNLALMPLNGGAPTDLRQAAAGRPVVVNLWAS